MGQTKTAWRAQAAVGSREEGGQGTATLRTPDPAMCGAGLEGRGVGGRVDGGSSRAKGGLKPSLGSPKG